MTNQSSTLDNDIKKALQHIDQWQAREEKKILNKMAKQLRPPRPESIDKHLAAIKRQADRERTRVMAEKSTH